MRRSSSHTEFNAKPKRQATTSPAIQSTRRTGHATLIPGPFLFPRPQVKTVNLRRGVSVLQEKHAKSGHDDTSKPQSFITESLQWAFIASHFQGPLTGKTLSTKASGQPSQP